MSSYATVIERALAHLGVFGIPLLFWTVITCFALVSANAQAAPAIWADCFRVWKTLFKLWVVFNVLRAVFLPFFLRTRFGKTIWLNAVKPSA